MKSLARDGDSDAGGCGLGELGELGELEGLVVMVQNPTARH
ncbi:hypothetical protein [Streptomyces sp. NPDC006368]